MKHISKAIEENNGSLVRTDESKFCCAQWYLPGGDFRLARKLYVFFETQEEATKFNALFEQPPELCEMFSLDETKWDDHFSLIKYGTDGIFLHQNYL